MKSFKKVLSCAAAAAMAVTGLVGSISVGADDVITPSGGPFEGDATYISTYMKSSYQGKTAFEIQFKYTQIGDPSAPQSGEDDLGYNDTFEFLVFDTNWGGWNRTTVGPNGVNKDAEIAKGSLSTDTVYTVSVPISTIEGALSTGGSPYGINLQTGAQLGTSKVDIVSLKLTTGDTPYVQQEFTATGSWVKGTASTMTVSPAGAAVVNPNEWNIEVSALDLSAWKNPTVEVTATYASATTYGQAEILVNGTPVDANYPSMAAGTYTFTTEIPNTATSFLACYDGCTVTEVKVYDNTEGNVTTSVTGQTAATIANNMGVAWNLGNSLDANDGQGNPNEKAWSNPKTTKKLIQAVKAAGFNTIRVPVTYMNKIGAAPNYTIDADYLNRVQQVVDYAYDMGMYVIINIHSDGFPNVTGSWIDVGTTDTTARAAMVDKFGKVWSQIATKFANYDQRLVFESANELLINGRYTNLSASELETAYANINALNQKFVDVVRAAVTTGNTKNADRVLIIPGYNTNIDYTTTAAGFVKPTDSTANRLMLSVHYYDPSDFALSGSVTQWPTGEESASNYYSKAYMMNQLAKIRAFASSSTINMPVFLGEYGPEDKSNLSSRATYNYWLNYYASQFGIVTAYWDNGVSGTGGTALFDRINNETTSTGETLIDFIFAGHNRTAIPTL